MQSRKRLAYRLMEVGRYSEAIDLFTVLLQTEPDDADLQRRLRSCEVRNRKLSRLGSGILAEVSTPAGGKPQAPTVSERQAEYDALSARAAVDAAKTQAALGHLALELRQLRRAFDHYAQRVHLAPPKGRREKLDSWGRLLWIARELADLDLEAWVLEQWRKNDVDRDTVGHLAALAARRARLEDTPRPAPFAGSDRPRTPSRAGRLSRASLIFPHPYKTGGSSLRAGLYEFFWQGTVRIGQPAVKVQRAFEKIKGEGALALDDAGVDLVTGHFGFSFAEAGVAPRLAKLPLYVATVRDPIARAQSIYSYFPGDSEEDLECLRRLRVPSNPDINEVARRWLDQGGWVGWEGDQCRVLSGTCDFQATVRTIEERYIAVVTPAALPRMMAAWGSVLDMAPPQDLHRKRNPEPHPEIEPELVARLRRLYEADRRLVDYIRENEERIIERSANMLSDLR